MFDFAKRSDGSEQLQIRDHHNQIFGIFQAPPAISPPFRGPGGTFFCSLPEGLRGGGRAAARARRTDVGRAESCLANAGAYR